MAESGFEPRSGLTLELGLPPMSWTSLAAGITRHMKQMKFYEELVCDKRNVFFVMTTFTSFKVLKCL